MPSHKDLPVNNIRLLVGVFVCLSAKTALKLLSRRRREKIIEIMESVRDLCKKHVFSIKVLHSK